jgi:hypothetical protein
MSEKPEPAPPDLTDDEREWLQACRRLRERPAALRAALKFLEVLAADVGRGQTKASN